MPIRMRPARLGLLLALAAAPLAGRAAREVSLPDTQQIRAVIDAQLQAFAADDAKRAFSYASPSIRGQFGTPEVFMRMVREGYPVVYRPASRAFLKPEWAEQMVIQAVQMTDRAGVAWLASYQMQRQPDRRWRINGCIVVKGSAGQAT